MTEDDTTPASRNGNGPPPPDDDEDPADVHGVPDSTLGGYFAHHDRPPGFEGCDGQPYTVSIEVERTDNLVAPHAVFLVFPRWAETGLGIVGHVETPVLAEERTREAAVGRAESLSLDDVKRLLDEAIRRRGEDETP